MKNDKRYCEYIEDAICTNPIIDGGECTSLYGNRCKIFKREDEYMYNIINSLRKSSANEMVKNHMWDVTEEDYKENMITLLERYNYGKLDEISGF